MPTSPRPAWGPFHADQVRPGDRYELSNGHAMYCAPTGSDGGRAVSVGASVLRSDPAVTEIGIDVGYTPSPSRQTLRAPDIAIGNVPEKPGWVPGVPALAVEYAGRGQDEDDLAVKIREFLEAGTQLIWVVRLVGARHVEVHAPKQPVRVVGPGEVLTAPGILANPVPVEALWDPARAEHATVRNLLGVDSLEEALAHAREEGVSEGRDEGRDEAIRLLDAFEARHGRPPGSDELRALREVWRKDGLDAAVATLRG